jgi:hypothetical protein
MPCISNIGRISGSTPWLGFVKDLVNNICKHITDGNDILSITPVESGSFGEETKVGFPDEFDFVCNCVN